MRKNELFIALLIIYLFMIISNKYNIENNWYEVYFENINKPDREEKVHKAIVPKRKINYEQLEQQTIKIHKEIPSWSKEMVDSVVFKESSLNPVAYNGIHCGCPQLNEKYHLQPKGISCKQFKTWTCEAQIKFAYDVYWSRDADNIKTAAELWGYNLCPRSKRGDNDHIVLYCKVRDNKEYWGNYKLDIDKDGCITIYDLDKILKRTKYPKILYKKTKEYEKKQLF